jgi:hypothetical protein
MTNIGEDLCQIIFVLIALAVQVNVLLLLLLLQRMIVVRFCIRVVLLLDSGPIVQRRIDAIGA